MVNKETICMRSECTGDYYPTTVVDWVTLAGKLWLTGVWPTAYSWSTVHLLPHPLPTEFATSKAQLRVRSRDQRISDRSNQRNITESAEQWIPWLCHPYSRWGALPLVLKMGVDRPHFREASRSPALPLPIHTVSGWTPPPPSKIEMPLVQSTFLLGV